MSRARLKRYFIERVEGVTRLLVVSEWRIDYAFGSNPPLGCAAEPGPKADCPR